MVGWTVIPKIPSSNPEICKCCYLIWKRGLCRLYKLSILWLEDLSWITQVALNAITCIPQEGGWGIFDACGQRMMQQCNLGGRNQSEATTKPEIPAATRSWKKSRMSSWLQSLMGAQPSWQFHFSASDFRLLDFRTMRRNSVVLSH
jgi:hypothetical protein